MENKYHNINEYWYHHQWSYKSPPNPDEKFWYSLVGIILIVILCLLFCGCSTQYVPIETVRTEYQNHTDTIRQTDSIFREKETIIREADSATIAKLGLQLKNNEKAILILKRELERQVNKESEHRVDTVIKTDTIRVPYPVERKLSNWEKFKIDIGGIITFVLVVVVIIIMLKWLVRTKFRA